MYNSIIQIGSHIGNTTNDPIFANITKDTKLILVEPVPYLFNFLKQNYNRRFPDNNFIFINKAVSDTIGHKYLNVPSEENDYSKLPFWASQLSSFNDEHIIKHLPDSNIKTEKILVETTTLNQIIDDYNITELDFLHTDTEGHDYYILMSFNFKVKPKFIQFEYKHMDGILTVGKKYLELTEYLRKNGYEFVSQDSEDTVFKYKESYEPAINKLIKSLSIIIPVYNCEKYISRTIESIISSLDYFHANYALAEKVKSEIIVVNDCSTDNTTFFVSQFIGKKYPVKLVNHSINQGAGPARNTGFKNSQGEILFFCDGDDLFLPAHIYLCFMLLQGQYDEKTTFPLVQDNYLAQVNFLEQPVDAIKTKVKIEENIHPGWQQGIENSLPLNLCVRRNCHEFLDGFPEDPVYKKIGGAEDSAYYRYLCQFFKIAYVNLVTVEYIRYPGNSLDRQMPKFSQAPGAYQGILPHEKPELFAESRVIELARLQTLKDKYQQYLLKSSSEQPKNIQSTVEPVWKTQYVEFCQTKQFQYTQDWFSHNIPIWLQVLQRFVNQPNINFLEVGSWEGRSTCWLLDQILTNPSAKITCVDTFVGSVEHQNYESGYLESLEERFDFNIAQTGFANKVEKQKGSSQTVLRSLPLDHYDFYYVDGSHLAPDVLEDVMLGWRLVKVNGIIIFDDYTLKLSEKATENVKLAVDVFCTVFQEKIKILHQGYQIIIEKIAM